MVRLQEEATATTDLGRILPALTEPPKVVSGPQEVVQSPHRLGGLPFIKTCQERFYRARHLAFTVL